MVDKMNEEKELPRRKSTRLRDFDYNTTGAYFITICTENRRKILSQIVGGDVPDAPQNVGGDVPDAPTKQHSAVSQFVSTFKRFCNKEYGVNIWQRHFNDHVIRNRDDYYEHIKYISENPMRWYYDELYSK